MNNKLILKKLRPNAIKATKLLKALAHKERLLILCQLVAGEQNVGNLWQASQLSQSAFSQHLAVLRRHQLVKVRKTAQVIYYSIADPAVLKIIQVLHTIFCKD